MQANSVESVIESVGSVCGDIAKIETRSKLLNLEEKIKALPQLDMPVRHLFSGEIYARELLIPGGTILTGRMYLIDHIDMMVYGDMTVSGDDGTKRISGYNVFPSVAGKKRAGYAHSDTLWITFCKCEIPTEEYYLSSISIEDSFTYEQELIKRLIVDEADIQQAYDAMPEGAYCDYTSFKGGYLLAAGKITKIEADRQDFDLMCRDIGVSAEDIRKQSEVATNLVNVVANGVYVADSPINDSGLFTTNSYEAGDKIMMARYEDLRTMAGRYTNHSIRPNAAFKMCGDDIEIQAIRSINNEELTIDYRESYRLGEGSCQEQ
jgi:hypothetical protein